MNIAIGMIPRLRLRIVRSAAQKGNALTLVYRYEVLDDGSHRGLVVDHDTRHALERQTDAAARNPVKARDEFTNLLGATVRRKRRAQQHDTIHRVRVY